ncbi:AMP-binding protein [Evansella tamaricis]|uniref:AMP-binding protein n=1 Tax=Evansella tamaricis TaxID=2069301 RepID=A0ABS6JKY1_9BACI|nr:AMP-binding protein [Evansella tamaricis]MBU9714346.1 AMP-binding protein [Evansella tamaricis]
MNIEWNWLKKRAQLHPTKAAVIEGETGEQWNYQELYHLTRSTAVMLKQKGISRGDRVALLAPNGTAYLALLFACRELAAIFVPLNWRLSPIELQGLVDDSRPSRLFFDPTFEKLAEKLEGVPVETIDLKKWKGTYATGKREQLFSSLEERTASSGWFTVSGPGSSLDTPWLMIYTGGTTGQPKGAVLTYRSVFTNSINTVLTWGLSENDITITILPMFHTGGINALTIPVLHAGGTVVLYRQFEPDTIAKGILTYRCTIILMVPTMYRSFIETEEFQMGEFPHMNVFLSGGAPCPVSIYDAFSAKSLPFKEGYGLTEAGPNNFVISPEVAERKRGSVGKPMLFNEITVRNEAGNEVLPGEIGELVIYGDHLFDHYWQRSDETEKAVQGGGLLTGDLAYQDEDGDYYILGRKKEMLITGGENVYPLEVENVLAAYPNLLETAVVGIPDEQWGERVVAVVAVQKRIRRDPNWEGELKSQLKAFCREKLAGYKIPKEIYIFDVLPKTHVGKIDKKSIVDKIMQKKQVH